MNRIVDYKYSMTIGRAFDMLPVGIARRVGHVHFLTGTDPIYAGLHRHEVFRGTSHSYRVTPHVSYPWNAIDKHGPTTVVLPSLAICYPYIVIHELGHCLDEVLGFGHDAVPINAYAKTNRMEAFAEAFAAKFFWLSEEADDIAESDIATKRLWKELVL